MAKIKALQGIIYNDKKVDISKVVAPPYDVISPSMQNRFYNRDEHNIVKLILGKEKTTDTKNNNKYTRAKTLLNKWLSSKILTRDKSDSVYVYEQDYLYHGRKKTRIGFIALMKIEDPKRSGILPHEYTLAKPKVDRMNLIGHTKTNLSPIFSLFQDDGSKVNKILRRSAKSKKPIFTVDTEGVLHKLWRIDDKKSIDKIILYMREKKIFIADGHHRYEVALNYRNKMRKSKSFKKSMDYVMMYFSDLKERGNLTILSTHRVVRNIKQFNEKLILENLKRYFTITRTSSVEKCIECMGKAPKSKHIFTMYASKKKFYILTLKKKYPAEKLIKAKKTKALKKLDVTVLHDIIINQIPGFENKEGSIKYVRTEGDAVKVVDNGDYKLAFFVRPTDVMEMKRIAENGEMMPQKSTYFYPKLLTGLVVNKF